MTSQLRRLIILGAPGSGKGTISNRIVKEFRVSHLSSGDLLRSHINKETEIGKQVKQLVSSGKLVSDDIITKVFMSELSKLREKSWLLDGYPRTLSQCRALDEHAVRVDKVINLNVPFQVIIDRLKHRWIHPASGRIYNLEFNPPKVPQKDDVTGEPLIQRADDKEEVVLARLKTYEQQIKPIVDFFASKQLIQEFTGNTSDYLWPLIKTHLHSTTSSLSASTPGVVEETVTHTGQAFASDDFRRSRFENAPKLVNKNFGIDLVREDPVVVCDARVVWSSGGGPLGHPKVFINLDKNEVHDCGYSGRRFIKKKFYDPAKHGKSITYEQYLQQVLKNEE